jgi:hypothetical protein
MLLNTPSSTNKLMVARATPHFWITVFFLFNNNYHLPFTALFSHCGAVFATTVFLNCVLTQNRKFANSVILIELLKRPVLVRTALHTITSEEAQTNTPNFYEYKKTKNLRILTNFKPGLNEFSNTALGYAVLDV